MKPIKFEDLDLNEDEMEKIAAGARTFLGPDTAEDDYAAPDMEELPEQEETPSELVTRRNLRE